MNQKKFSLKSRFESFKFALKGYRSLLKNEHNSRIHILAAIVAIILGIIMKLESLRMVFADNCDWSCISNGTIEFFH